MKKFKITISNGQKDETFSLQAESKEINFNPLIFYNYDN